MTAIPIDVEGHLVVQGDRDAFDVVGAGNRLVVRPATRRQLLTWIFRPDRARHVARRVAAMAPLAPLWHRAGIRVEVALGPRTVATFAPDETASLALRLLGWTRGRVSYVDLLLALLRPVPPVR